MADFEIRIDATEFTRWLDEAPEIALAAVQRALYRAAARGSTELKRTAPKATSNLANSIRVFSTQDGAEIVASANYASFVHDGRAPGRFPNLDNIADWARVVGIPEDAVWPIARSIAQRGTRTRPWFKDYIESNEFVRMTRDLIENEVQRALA